MAFYQSLATCQFCRKSSNRIFNQNWNLPKWLKFCVKLTTVHEYQNFNDSIGSRCIQTLNVPRGSSRCTNTVEMGTLILSLNHPAEVCSFKMGMVFHIWKALVNNPYIGMYCRNGIAVYTYGIYLRGWWSVYGRSKINLPIKGITTSLPISSDAMW